ncbi:MAG: tRNA pseudouridine(55) synthase TruB [Desulfobulbaceae bacterium]|nr:MAG: tRNA pseudouridine(55) synthase TruB [Desulfobulbaceae bacterium]
MTALMEPGVLLVDKPAGKSSFALVRVVRKLTGIKKVGHAGTLDPFATGLLVICIGRPATKMISQFMDSDKEYLATLRLGAVSTTLDPEGEISPTDTSFAYRSEEIEAVLDRFRGEIKQVPPAYSALKHKGKPLYHYARQGVMIEKEPRTVHIHSLECFYSIDMIDTHNPILTCRVVCSKGTYIRSLAADIGKALGCGAYLSELRRTRSGVFSVDNAVNGRSLYGDYDPKKISDDIIQLEAVQNMLH